MIIGFFIGLFVLDWSLYFRHAGHFFQGDTVFLLAHRVHSLSGFLREFAGHPSGWYRPLANEPIESLFYPFFGLHPIAYRVPVYAVFFAITAAVYRLVFSLSRRRLIAAVATVFFSIHSTNAYTTYDVGFMPELLYAFFYIGSVLAYWKYLKQGKRSALFASIGCFVGALLSKEAAVTVPATLVVMHLLMGPPGPLIARRFIAALRSTAVHTALAAAHSIFLFGYLHVVGITVAKLMEEPAATDGASYDPVFNAATVLTNARLGVTWAFNLPRGWWGHFRNLTPAMLAFLKIFRIFVLAGTAVLLLTHRRNLLLFGAAWFFITLLPALPLATHFLPYYTFLPIAGLSMMVGVVVTWTYDLLRHFHPFAAAAFLVVIFSGTFYVTNRAIRQEIRDNLLLGDSAQVALNSVNDMKQLFPVLPRNASLYFEDKNEPLGWIQSSGDLFRMAYGVDDVSAGYASQGDPPPSAAQGSTIVIAVRNKHLFIVR